MPVSLEKPQVAPMPGQNPAEMLPPGQPPQQAEMGAAAQVPMDEVHFMGSEAVDHTIAVEATYDTHEAAAGALLWNELAAMTTEREPYSHKEHPLVSRLPLSLPTSSISKYDTDAINFAIGPDLKGALEMSGVDAATIEETEKNGWYIDASKLPQELQHTVLTANLYEAVEMSRDPAQKHMATERNSHTTPEDIWQPSTLHHSTSISNLANILKNGHLSFDMDRNGNPVSYHGRIQGRGEVQFGVPWNKVGPDASYEEKLKDLSYYGHGSGMEGVYLHYTRPQKSYREGEEYMSSYEIKAMSGGMPATEISAITMNCPTVEYKTKANQINKVRDELIETEMYIPIFTIDGELAYSREAFDADINSKKAGTYETEAMRQEKREAEKQARFEREYLERMERDAREAIDRNMTVEELGEWRRQQPPPQF